MRRRADHVTGFFRFAVAFGAIATVAACASAPPPSAQSPAAPAPAAPVTRAVPLDEPTVVALLTPTTAQSDRVRAIAQDLTAAAQMARADHAGDDFIVKVYDTKGDDAGARAAAASAVAEGASLIVGPLRGPSAAAAGSAAKSAGVNILSFSNDASVAGDNVWVLGRRPYDELERIFGYAASQGVDAVAIAYPTNRYGELIAAEAAAAGEATGVSVGPFFSYERSFKGIENATPAGSGAIIGSGVDGVLIADSGDALRSTAAFLNFHDVSTRQFRYMGVSRWADSKNTREDALIGGWFSAPDPNARTAFSQRFEAEMGRRPSALAEIAYDAMAAAAILAKEARASGSNQPFAKAEITRGRGFDGASGQVRLTADGVAKRGLAILQVRRDGLIVVDPARDGAPGA